MQETEITTYSPNYRLKIGFFQTWGTMIRNIVNSKELIWQLFRRDFLMSYKKSFLGMWWILLSPIIGIVSWVFLNSTGILNPGDVGIPFPAYVLLSSSIWGLFMGFYGAAAGTLGAGSGFIMQVKFPHEALLAKQTAQHLAGFLITLGVNVVVLLLFGIVPSWGILLFPLVALPLFFLGAAIGLVVSVVSVVASDISSVISTLLGFALYVTPVIYAADTQNSFLQKVTELNPLTYLIGAVRDMTIYGRIDHFDRYVFVSVIAFLLFMFSWRLFFVSEDKVIEKMI